MYSLTAAGRKDLRYLSFTHLGCISLLLKELPSRAVAVTAKMKYRDFKKPTALHGELPPSPHVT